MQRRRADVLSHLLHRAVRGGELLGEFQERQEAQNRLLLFGLGAALGVLILLITAFGSVRLAVLLFLTLPFALVGGVFAAWIGGGVISLGWAIDHPEQLAGVMLLNTAVHQPADTRIPSPLRLALSPGVLGTATVTTPAFAGSTAVIPRQ